MKKFAKKTLYVYEINGREKVTITSTEEAERWDRIFASAERLDELFQAEPPEISIEEDTRTELCLWMAEHSDSLTRAFQQETSAPRPAPAEPARVEPPPKAEPKAAGAGSGSGAGPGPRAVKRQSFVQDFKRPVPPSKDGFGL